MSSDESDSADNDSAYDIFASDLESDSKQEAVSKRTIHRPPLFTLLSTTPQNPIIAQRQFQCSRCIPSDLADLRIKDPAVLLARLNDILGTVYSFHSTPALKGIMLDCISKGYDLGMAYGMLRHRWSSISPNLLSRFKLLENNDRERREAAVVDGLIKDVRMPPRRVWDLYSNRVLPFWAVDMRWNRISLMGYRVNIGAVSHAWMSAKQRIDKDTPINGHQWPVPIPQDINLDDLRIELLNLQSKGRTEYAWLDVLCLRQKGRPLEEQLLAQEWEIDVPTIGTIYEHCLYTVLYLNGLGRPFKKNNLDDARHWCNRAWTVQEWCCGTRGPFTDWFPVLAGNTEQSPRFEISQHSARGYCDFTKRLEVRMNGSEALVARTNIIEAAAMMSKRHAERDLDRLAGLAYLACGETQPVFNTTTCVDDAWLPFIDCMTPTKRWQLLLLFPVTGDHDYKWAPSWNQLLRHAKELVENASYRSDQFSEGLFGIECCPAWPIRLVDATSSRNHSRLHHSPKDQNGKHGYSCLVVCLPNCRLDGFDSSEFTSVDDVGRKIRRGTVSFYVPERYCNTDFNLIACHSHPIPSGGYCLLTGYYIDPLMDHVGTLCYWVVGLLDEEERFHKISVLEFDVENERVELAAGHFRKNLAEELALNEGGLESNPWVRRVKLT